MDANAFDDLDEALFGKKFPSARKVFDLQRMSPQLLQGHGVLCEAAKATDEFAEITQERGEFGGHRLGFVGDDERVISKKNWLLPLLSSRFYLPDKHICCVQKGFRLFRQASSTAIVPKISCAPDWPYLTSVTGMVAR